jgi:hypothetical protein
LYLTDTFDGFTVDIKLLPLLLRRYGLHSPSCAAFLFAMGMKVVERDRGGERERKVSTDE